MYLIHEEKLRDSHLQEITQDSIHNYTCLASQSQPQLVELTVCGKVSTIRNVLHARWLLSRLANTFAEFNLRGLFSCFIKCLILKLLDFGVRHLMLWLSLQVGTYM